ncbi:MAG: hypothetical protein IMZ74_18835 [Actinobacteria bacterium]|nr:hypothetical protein [Actinomycetota bacterium]
MHAQLQSERGVLAPSPGVHYAAAAVVAEAVAHERGARRDPAILGAPIAAARALAGMAWCAGYVAAQAGPPPRRRAKEDPP